MKKSFILLLLCIINFGLSAQTYQLNISNNNYIALDSSDKVSAANWDDDPILDIDLGFNFNFYGSTQSKFNIDPNGNIYFGNQAFVTVIDAFGANLYDDPNDSIQSEIRVKTRGIIGSKYCIIEWHQAKFYLGDSNDIATFQIKLYQYGRIEFNYGKINAKSASFGSIDGPFCGIWDDNASEYMFLYGNPQLPSKDYNLNFPFPNLSSYPTENTQYSFSIYTSASKLIKATSFHIFPQPAHSILNINFKTVITTMIEIYSLNGELEQSQIIDNLSEVILDIQNLPEGVHLLKIGDTYQKFIKW